MQRLQQQQLDPTTTIDPLDLILGTVGRSRRVSLGAVVQNALWKKRHDEAIEKRKVQERMERLTGTNRKRTEPKTDGEEVGEDKATVGNQKTASKAATVPTRKKTGENALASALNSEKERSATHLPKLQQTALMASRPKTTVVATYSTTKRPIESRLQQSTRQKTANVAATATHTDHTASARTPAPVPASRPKAFQTTRPPSRLMTATSTSRPSTYGGRNYYNMSVVEPLLPPPPPDEESFATRPMSPHKSYNLSDHIRAAALRAHPTEHKDNFEQRMRGLFLPSLFQSSENIVVPGSQQNRRRRDDDGGSSPNAEPSSRQQSARLGDRAGSRPTSTMHRRRLRVAMRPGAHVPSAAVAASDAMEKYQAASERARLRQRSARFRAFMSKGGKGGSGGGGGDKVKYPMATIDRQYYEENPPDLDIVALRWHFAMYWALMQNRIRIKVLEDKIDDIEEAGDRTAGDVVAVSAVDDTHRLNLRQMKLEVIAVTRVWRILAIPPAHREEKDLDQLDSILGHLKLFAKLPLSHRFKIFAASHPEIHPRGAVLISENHQARSLYVIMSGECLLQIRPNNPVSSVTMRLTVGQVAGEFTTFNLNEPRIQRVTCMMQTEVLRIDKMDYVTVCREARTHDVYIAEYFSTVPTFLSAEKALHNLLSQRSVVRNYEPGTLLIRASEVSANTYFIVRGKVRVLHLVTFVKTDLGPIPGSTRHRYSLVPLNSRRGNSLGPRDELVRELAGVVELGPGQFFPPLVKSRIIEESANPILVTAAGIGTGLKRQSVNLDDVAAAVAGGGGISNYYDPESAPPSPFTFVVTEKLESVVIARQDLIELVPHELYRRLNDNSLGITNVSSEEVEERYLASQGWRGSMELDKRVLKELNNVDSFKDKSWSNPVTKAVIADAKSLAEEAARILEGEE